MKKGGGVFAMRQVCVNKLMNPGPGERLLSMADEIAGDIVSFSIVSSTGKCLMALATKKKEAPGCVQRLVMCRSIC